MPTRQSTDLDCDDKVTMHDFALFAEHYSTSAGSPRFDKKCDFNDDNEIMLDDLVYIAQDWIQPK